MNFKRLLNTEIGRTLVSMILGIGLAALFRKVCKDKNCIVFNGPVIGEFENKTYKHGKKCFKYSLEADVCQPAKQIVDIGEPMETFVDNGSSYATYS